MEQKCFAISVRNRRVQGLHHVGVCGKKPDVAAMQDLVGLCHKRNFGYYDCIASGR